MDGIDNVIDILEKVEDDTLNNVTYIEALACTDGCLGGALAVENPFISRNILKKWIHQDKEQIQSKNSSKLQEKIKQESSLFEKPLMPRTVFSLDEDRQRKKKK